LEILRNIGIWSAWKSTVTLVKNLAEGMDAAVLSSKSDRD
jgi:hypothetical protein